MGRLEVQGIVSVQTGEPLVQFRQLDDEGNAQVEWQAGVSDAREMAQQVLEAAMNATYDAAIISWSAQMWPDDMTTGPMLLLAIRKHRADTWGLPDQPQDWR